AAVHQATIRPGIMVADDGSLCFAVTAGSGTVSITAGIAHLSGPAWLYKKTSTTLNVPTPTNYGRIDRVVLYADFVNKSTGIELKAGTPASSPVPPDLTRTTSRFELSLAQVTVTTAGTLTVTDERTNVSVCGGIRMRDCSEFDAYVRMMQTSIENWFNVQQGGGWRQTYVQEIQPPSSVTDGALWLDTTDNQLKQYDAITLAWNPLYIKPNVADIYRNNNNLLFGVKMSGDCVKGHTYATSCFEPIPFSIASEGFSKKTDYAELVNSGRVKILRKGYYGFSANMFVSDSPGLQGTYHMRIYNTRTGVTIGENYVHTATINPNYICSGNPNGYAYCNEGDIITTFIAPPAYNHLYRLDAKQTHFEVAPYAFLE
ncbi:MAG: hypothetical protein RSB35_05760, partial [Eubacterium sp.]